VKINEIKWVTGMYSFISRRSKLESSTVWAVSQPIDWLTNQSPNGQHSNFFISMTTYCLLYRQLVDSRSEIGQQKQWPKHQHQIRQRLYF